MADEVVEYIRQKVLDDVDEGPGHAQSTPHRGIAHTREPEGPLSVG